MFIKIKYVFIYLFYLCATMVLGRSEDNFRELGLSFPHVDARDGTQVGRFGGKYFLPPETSHWHQPLSSL